MVGGGNAARPTVRIPYAERKLATGRAVSARLMARKTHQARAWLPALPGPAFPREKCKKAPPLSGRRRCLWGRDYSWLMYQLMNQSSKVLSKRWKITAACARLVLAMGARVSAVMPVTMPWDTAQAQASLAKGRT